MSKNNSDKRKSHLLESVMLMSAKTYRDKKALSLVEKLKEIVKSLTIKCVLYFEELKTFAEKADFSVILCEKGVIYTPADGTILHCLCKNKTE